MIEMLGNWCINNIILTPILIGIFIGIPLILIGTGLVVLAVVKFVLLFEEKD